MPIKNFSYSNLLLLLITFFCFGVIIDEAKVNAATSLKVRIVKMNKADRKLLDGKADHPIRFNTENINKALISLQYKEKELLTWGRGKRIFNKRTATQFASLIKKAFLKAKSNAKISFSVPASSGKTTGYLFAKEGSLIFQFKTIDGIEHVDAFSLQNESNADVIANWMIVPGPGQEIYAAKGFLGLPMKQKAMVIAKLRQSKKRNEKEEEKIVSINDGELERAGKRKRIEKKLHYLKKLRRENLITEKAYEKKIQDLLDRL